VVIVEGSILILGLGVTAFIILYMVQAQTDRHFLLKILGIFFALFFVMLIPHTIYVMNTASCYTVMNETGDQTRLTEVCDKSLEPTSGTFVRLMTSFYIILLTYVILFFLWDLLGVRVVRMLANWGVIKKKRYDDGDKKV